MYVKNIQKQDIKLTSFEGYKFLIPPGVSWMWDKAGEHLLTNIYKVETPQTPGNKDRYGFDNGHGVPPLISATKQQWVKDGKKLAQVERFMIDARQIPRAKLITVAKQRGVEDKKIMEFLADPNIDSSVIGEAINSLPIPDDIRYPADLETDDETQT